MKYHYILLLLILQLHTYGCSQKSEYSNHLIQDGEGYFKNLRQLTFSGENAEAYISADGKYLVFVSNRNQKKTGDTNIFICEWVE